MEPIFAFVGVVLAALVTYLVAARQFSGKIETSDAKELWAESRSIRDWSQGRIESLNSDVEELRQRVAALEVNNEELMGENRKLQDEIRELGTTITELREEIRVLTGELKESRNRVNELEEEAPNGG